MIDWLRRQDKPQTIELSGREVPIVVNRNARAKRLTLRLSPDGKEVRLTAPRWAPTGEALAFAHMRTEWLEQQLAAVPQRATPVPGGTVRYRGQDITIVWDEARPRKPVLAGAAITLGGPQDTLVKRLQRWLESDALPLLEADLAEYCNKAGVALPGLRLSRARHHDFVGRGPPA